MRKKLNRIVWVIALAFSCIIPQGAFASIDTIAVDVGISVFKTTPIGIVPFEEKAGIDWIEEKPHQILTRDANLFVLPYSALLKVNLWTERHTNNIPA